MSQARRERRAKQKGHKLKDNGVCRGIAHTLAPTNINPNQKERISWTEPLNREEL